MLDNFLFLKIMNIRYLNKTQSKTQSFYKKINIKYIIFYNKTPGSGFKKKKGW